MIIVFLVFLVLFVVCLYFHFNNKFVVNKFIDNNCIVYGPKGSGKDLIFQIVVNLRKEKYFSNINFGGKFNYVDVSDISVYPNDYEKLISNDIVIIKKDLNRESADVYLSDAGIYLPSQYDFMLSKKFKSFPVYYALSRHLYCSNVHLNTQALGRVWLKIREQADHYFLARGVVKFGPFIFVKLRYYSQYSSAEAKKLPLKRVRFNKYSRADVEKFKAEHGVIKDLVCVILKHKIKYDTRYFHKLFFGYSYKKKKKDEQNKINVFHKLRILWSEATSRRKAETIYKKTSGSELENKTSESEL